MESVIKIDRRNDAFSIRSKQTLRIIPHSYNLIVTDRNILIISNIVLRSQNTNVPYQNVTFLHFAFSLYDLCTKLKANRIPEFVAVFEQLV